LWALILMLMLDNLGVNVTAMVAGLGVGGIAVALAVQNILGDLFASLSIVVDKPFVVGDSITVDSFTGTVEQVGLKTTRLRSLT
ncbi:mechanosensitive ion channel domain-containing protein, partial [Acinetobacter baumannii]